MYPDLKRCEEEAVNLLLSQDLDHFPLSLFNFTFQKNILIDSIQNYCAVTGTDLKNYTGLKGKIKDGVHLYFPSKNLYLILYHEKITNRERLYFTLAHELGHIYLGHQKDDPLQEIEANYFASHLLIPEVILSYILTHYQDVTLLELASFFRVSKGAMNRSITRYRKKSYHRQKTPSLLLLKKVRPFIDSYFQKDGSTQLI